MDIFKQLLSEHREKDVIEATTWAAFVFVGVLLFRLYFPNE